MDDRTMARMPLTIPIIVAPGVPAENRCTGCGLVVDDKHACVPDGLDGYKVSTAAEAYATWKTAEDARLVTRAAEAKAVADAEPKPV